MQVLCELPCHPDNWTVFWIDSMVPWYCKAVRSVVDSCAHFFTRACNLIYRNYNSIADKAIMIDQVECGYWLSMEVNDTVLLL